MSNIPIDLIPQGEQKFSQLTSIADAGILMALNVESTGSQYLSNTLPDEWLKHYDANHLETSDPILTWAKANEGAIRWSSIGLRDPKNVIEQARNFGLHYGVSCAHQQDDRRNILVGASRLREFTDNEMGFFQKTLVTFSKFAFGKFDISSKQLEILALLADGYSIGEISAKLELQKSTVNARISKAKLGLAADTTVSAVATAIRWKLI